MLEALRLVRAEPVPTKELAVTVPEKVAAVKEGESEEPKPRLVLAVVALFKSERLLEAAK